MPMAVAMMPPSEMGASKQRVMPCRALQLIRDPEYAAEVTDVLSENQRIGIAR